jgi:conjugal transfer pilus assembly protein TraL
MNNPVLYTMIRNLDEPQRVLGLTIDEFFIVVLGLMLLMMTSYRILTGLFCFALYLGLKHIKRGQAPRFLLVLIYWYLPKEISQFFLISLPASHLRVWRV